MCGCQWQRPVQHRAPDRHQQMISKVCNSPADKNMTGIKEIDQACQHITDHLPAVADDIERGLISLPACCIDILRAKYSTVCVAHLPQRRAAPVSSRLQRLGCDRRSRRHGFQASLVAAGAQRTFLIHTDMTDVTCAAVTAAM